MSNPFDDDPGDYLVLVNAEGQYSLWPARFPAPGGWKQVGPSGDRAMCLAWIDVTWSDQRPRSLIESMNARHGG